ncbi:MAG: hypothetical protein HYZ49_03090 [Chloroflexi bacterium]|nr:hypothetical protein [Chloroflexota bacterium]
MENFVKKGSDMKTTKLESSIPGAIKIYAGIGAALSLFFAFAVYFNPAQVSDGAVLDNTSIKFAFYTAGASSLGLGVGLILAILSNRPKSMALMLITRVVVAIQDMLIAIVLATGTGRVAFQAVIVIFGIASIVKLFTIIRSAEKQAG